MIPGFSYLGIIILVLIIITIILGVRWLSKWIVAKRGFFVLGGYSVILLISLIIYYFIPVSAEEETEGSGHPGHQEIYNSILYGEEDMASMEEYILEEWEFPFEDDSLRIESRGNINYDIRVMAERTDNDVIKASFYRTPLYFEGRKIENDSVPVNVRLESGRLDLLFREITEEVNIASFSKEFPMKQFEDTKNEPFGFAFGMDIGWSEQLLFLQVPKDIEISTGSGVQLDFIN